MNVERQDEKSSEESSEYRSEFTLPESFADGMLMGCGFLIATLGGMCTMTFFSSDSPGTAVLAALFLLGGIVMFLAGKSRIK
jgi:hypothetical protein